MYRINLTRRTILPVLMVIFLLGMYPLQVEANSDYLSITNEYIRIVVNTSQTNTGRFSVGTTGGDPDRATDQNKHLIYGGEEPWTTYTTVRVGNESWVFGNPTNRRAGRDGKYGEMITPPLIEDGAIVSRWKTGPIEVTQRLSFARSITTGLQDTARIEYRLHNSDTVTHLTGLRITLDTMLGENDGAPFRVNDQALLTDRVFYAHEMPEFWQAFDSLNNPQVMAQGTLRGQEVSTPDRVYFTNWGSLADDLWNFDFQPGRDFTRKGEFDLDSAIALFWDPVPLRPGETRSFVAYYGLGGVTIAPGDLSVGVTSPSQVTADSTFRQSFPIIAYIQNSGQGEARNVSAQITLPKGLQLVEGSERRSLGNLEVGDTIQTSWQVIPSGEITGKLTYHVSVDSINSESNSVRRDVDIVSPAKVRAELIAPPGLKVESERLTPVPIEVSAIIKNVGGTEAHRLEVQMDHPIGLELAQGDRSVKYLGSLAPGKEERVTWYLTPVGITGNLPYTLKVQSSAGQQVVNDFVLVPEITPKVWLSKGTSSQNQQIKVGDYFSVSVWATNIADFRRAEFDVYFNPDTVSVVGKTLDITKGTLFVDDSVSPPKSLGWVMPTVDNTRGRITGFVGDRGLEKPLPLSFGTLVTIHFRAKAPGDAMIRVQNVDLYNSEGRVAQFQVVGRTIAIER